MLDLLNYSIIKIFLRNVTISNDKINYNFKKYKQYLRDFFQFLHQNGISNILEYYQETYHGENIWNNPFTMA